MPEPGAAEETLPPSPALRVIQGFAQVVLPALDYMGPHVHPGFEPSRVRTL